MINYFLYARKSTDVEDKQVLSIESQLAELRDVAKRENLNIADEFIEKRSAKMPGRPIFNDMLRRIQTGEAQGIICWKIDRLARNPVDGGQIQWLLQQGVIQHIQTHDRSHYPNDNVLMMSVELGMANEYIRQLSANTARGLRQKARQGDFPGKAPFGYINNPAIKKISLQKIFGSNLTLQTREASGIAQNQWLSLAIAKEKISENDLVPVMEPMVGFEPTTHALRKRCSTN